MSDQYLRILRELADTLDPQQDDRARSFDARHEAGMRADALRWILSEHKLFTSDPHFTHWERTRQEPLYHKASKFRAQRDELLEVVRECRALLNDAKSCHPESSAQDRYWNERRGDTVAKAAAALARVEGE